MTRLETVLLATQADERAGTLERLERAGFRVHTAAGDWRHHPRDDVDCVVHGPATDPETVVEVTRDDETGTPMVRAGTADGSVSERGMRDAGDESEPRFPGVVTEVCAAVENRHTVEHDVVSALHDAFRNEPDALDAVGRHVVDAVGRAVALPYAAVALVDEDEGVLRPAALSPELSRHLDEHDRLVFGPEHRHVWNAFARKRTATFDASDEGGVYRGLTPVRSEVAVPIGDYGLLVTGTAAADRLGSSTVDAARLLGTYAEFAFDRCWRRRELRTCQRERERYRYRLSRVNHINDKVRKMDLALVEAETRDEIERVVCERLLTSERFAFAWVGELGADGDELRVRDMAGNERGYLDSVSLAADEGGDPEPAVEAAVDGEVTVVSSVAEGRRTGSWREEALLRDFHSIASVPLVYDDIVYGVVSVYAARPNAFHDLAVSVLSEMGKTIGYAINAAKRRAALLSDGTVELQLQVRDPGDVFSRLAKRVDCRIAVEGITPRSDAEHVVYATVEGPPPEEVVTLPGDATGVERVRRVNESRPDLFEFVISGQCLPVVLANLGANPQSVTLAGGETRVTVTVPRETDVRSFLDQFETKHPGVTLLSRREHDRRSDDEGPPLAETGLTERQREVLETAYLNGFFEWPRERTGEEVAESLNISQPAFLQHVRACERKLARAVFESGD